MTVLFQTDFEDTAGQGTVVVPTGMAGWTYDTSSWLVFEASLVGRNAVNGTRVCGRETNIDRGYYTTGGMLTDQAVRHAFKWETHTSPPVIAHMLRRYSSTQWYYALIETNGASLRVSLNRNDSGTTNLANSSYVLACSVGDVIHQETKMIGTTLECRIWKNSEARPTTATVSATDSTFSSGYAGLIKYGGSGYAVADRVVITDGAGGEDYFYPASSGASATVTGTASLPAFSGSAQVAPVTSITVTTALPAFSGSAQVSPVTSITVTTALPAFSGGASMASASATVTATTSLPSYSGGATGDTSAGTLTLPVLKNNTGTVLANETGATVHVYSVSTGNKIVTKTGQTTNASGVMTVTDALIVGGTQYRVVVVLGSGAEGLDKVTAS